MITPIGEEPETTAEDKFLTDLFPRVTERLADQYAEDYDARAGRSSLAAWLGRHTDPTSTTEPLAAPEPQSASADLVEDIAPGPDLEMISPRRSQRRLRHLLRTLRRWRPSGRSAVAALLVEDRHIAAGRDPMLPTHGETLVRAEGKTQADALLARSQRRLDRLVREVDDLRAQQTMLTARAAYRQHDLVAHPDGGREVVSRMLDDQTHQRAQIAADIAEGSRKHQRLPRWMRKMPMLVLLVDFSLLLYFMAGITNVNWVKPASVSLAFAVSLAAMMALLSYGFLNFTGHRLRAHKGHSGGIHFDALDRLTKTTAWLAGADIAAITTIMFTRMRSEVLYALGPHAWATALIIALMLAVVGALANFLIVAIRAIDGSDEVDRLESISAAIRGPLSRSHQMLEQAALIPARIAIRQRLAQRAAVQAVTRAGRHLAAAEQAIDAARAIHQGAGPYSEPAANPNTRIQVAGYRDDQSAPQADLRALRLALEHIDDTKRENGSPVSDHEPVEEGIKLHRSAG
jgi:hypothetical protein